MNYVGSRQRASHKTINNVRDMFNTELPHQHAKQKSLPLVETAPGPITHKEYTSQKTLLLVASMDSVLLPKRLQQTKKK